MDTPIIDISLHSNIDAQGNRIAYARIIERRPQQIVGLSVLLHRLSPEQLRIAKPESTA